MSDRILARFLWLVIMSMIAVTALGGLLLIYTGLFRLIGRDLESGSFAFGSGLLLAGGCWALCCHSDDLIDRTR
jgi:hypothetical protein